MGRRDGSAAQAKGDPWRSPKVRWGTTCSPGCSGLFSSESWHGCSSRRVWSAAARRDGLIPGDRVGVAGEAEEMIHHRHMIGVRRRSLDHRIRNLSKRGVLVSGAGLRPERRRDMRRVVGRIDRRRRRNQGVEDGLVVEEERGARRDLDRRAPALRGLRGRRRGMRALGLGLPREDR